MTKKTTFIFIIALLVSFTIQAQPVHIKQKTEQLKIQGQHIFTKEMEQLGNFKLKYTQTMAKLQIILVKQLQYQENILL